MNKCIKCGSYAFNLYKEGIDQGGLCDVHYWQGRAHRAEALMSFQDGAQPAVAEQHKQEPVAYIHRNEYNEYRLEPHDHFDIRSIPFNVDVLLFKAPLRKPLTVEQRNEIARQADENDWHDYDIIDAVEAAHGITGEQI